MESLLIKLLLFTVIVLLAPRSEAISCDDIFGLSLVEDSETDELCNSKELEDGERLCPKFDVKCIDEEDCQLAALADAEWDTCKDDEICSVKIDPEKSGEGVKWESKCDKCKEDSGSLEVDNCTLAVVFGLDPQDHNGKKCYSCQPGATFSNVCEGDCEEATEPPKTAPPAQTTPPPQTTDVDEGCSPGFGFDLVSESETEVICEPSTKSSKEWNDDEHACPKFNVECSSVEDCKTKALEDSEWKICDSDEVCSVKIEIKDDGELKWEVKCENDCKEGDGSLPISGATCTIENAFAGYDEGDDHNKCYRCEQGLTFEHLCHVPVKKGPCTTTDYVEDTTESVGCETTVAVYIGETDIEDVEFSESSTEFCQNEVSTYSTDRVVCFQQNVDNCETSQEDCLEMVQTPGSKSKAQGWTVCEEDEICEIKIDVHGNSGKLKYESKCEERDKCVDHMEKEQEKSDVIPLDQCFISNYTSFIDQDYDKCYRCDETTIDQLCSSKPGGHCVSSCDGLADGNYQSCDTCAGYVACGGGLLYDMPCPATLVWDDSVKRCEWTSTSCKTVPVKNGLCTTTNYVEDTTESVVCETTTVITYIGETEIEDVAEDVEEDVEFSESSTEFCETEVSSYSTDRVVCFQQKVDNCETSQEDCFEMVQTPGSKSKTQGWTVCEQDEVCEIKIDVHGNSGKLKYESKCEERDKCVDHMEKEQDKSDAIPLDQCFISNYTSFIDQDYDKCYRCDETTIEQLCSSKSASLCVSSCDGLADGNYQSCDTCEGYVACGGGILYNMPCPATLVWDDSVKRCEWTSTSCVTEITVNHCVSSCDGITDGNYQSCDTCAGYVACSGGILYNMPCAATLVWDDSVKTCGYESNSCATEETVVCKTKEPPKPTDEPDSDSDETTEVDDDDKATEDPDDEYETTEDPIDQTTENPDDEATDGPTVTCRCVSSCDLLDDGNYQSCQGCDVYRICIQGNLIDNQACPDQTFWDQSQLLCVAGASSTCTHSDECIDWFADLGDDTTESPDETTNGTEVNCRCVSSCEGLADGNYQSCQACNVFGICIQGNLIDNQACPGNTFWDQSQLLCVAGASSTCTHSDECIDWFADLGDDTTESPDETTNGTEVNCRCVSSCEGLADGNYQSCQACNVFGICIQGNLIDNQACPGNTFWDQSQLLCVAGASSTCTHSDECIDWFADLGDDTTESPDETTDGTEVNCRCVSSCEGLADGNYQSCQACNVFGICIQGNLIDNQACPGNTFWDQSQLLCVAGASSTCTHSEECIDWFADLGGGSGGSGDGGDGVPNGSGDGGSGGPDGSGDGGLDGSGDGGSGGPDGSGDGGSGGPDGSGDGGSGGPDGSGDGGSGGPDGSGDGGSGGPDGSGDGGSGGPDGSGDGGSGGPDGSGDGGAEGPGGSGDGGSGGLDGSGNGGPGGPDGSGDGGSGGPDGSGDGGSGGPDGSGDGGPGGPGGSGDGGSGGPDGSGDGGHGGPDGSGDGGSGGPDGSGDGGSGGPDGSGDGGPGGPDGSGDGGPGGPDGSGDGHGGPDGSGDGHGGPDGSGDGHGGPDGSGDGHGGPDGSGDGHGGPDGSGDGHGGPDGSGDGHGGPDGSGDGHGGPGGSGDGHGGPDGSGDGHGGPDGSGEPNADNEPQCDPNSDDKYTEWVMGPCDCDNSIKESKRRCCQGGCTGQLTVRVVACLSEDCPCNGASSSQLQCLSCEDAASMEDCLHYGCWESCAVGAIVCITDIVNTTGADTPKTYNRGCATRDSCEQVDQEYDQYNADNVGSGTTKHVTCELGEVDTEYRCNTVEECPNPSTEEPSLFDVLALLDSSANQMLPMSTLCIALIVSVLMILQ